jgi:hypothetical protein
MAVCQVFSVAAQELTVVRAIAVSTLGAEPFDSTKLFGAGVTVHVNDIVQVFADGQLEIGRSYPPDRPVSTGPSGPPVQIVLAELTSERIDRLLVAGLRLSVPPGHRVRPFLELGAGLARARNAYVTFTVPQTTEYSSRHDRLAAIGGGISTSLSRHIVVDVGYRWHQQFRDGPTGSFSALHERRLLAIKSPEA